jgi:hypothetical protein
VRAFVGAKNSVPNPRTATLTVAGQFVTASQESSFGLTSLNPKLGIIGEVVTIIGSQFGDVVTWGSGIIEVRVPVGATTGPTVVTVGGQVSNGVTFTVATSGPLTITGHLTCA